MRSASYTGSLISNKQQVDEYDGYTSARFQESGAFYALQSCHQILHGDAGEFFSPDYLCSHPPLWCNWTVRAPRGMRVRLYLEDLTPESACGRKTDQVHLDEPPAPGAESRVLERCWRSAVFTSASDVVHVVQLISPNPEPPHRGFYGAYRALGTAEIPAVQSVDHGEHVPQATNDEEESKPDESDTLPGEQSISNEFPPQTESLDDAHAERLNRIDPWTNQRSALTTASWNENSGEIRKTRAKSGNPNRTSDPNPFAPPHSATPTSGGVTLHRHELEPDPTWSSTARPTAAVTSASAVSESAGTSEEHDGSSPGDGTKAAKRRKQSNKIKDESAPVQNRRPLGSNPAAPTHPTRPTSTHAPSSNRAEPDLARSPDDPAAATATSASAMSEGAGEHDGSSPGDGTEAAERREPEKSLPVRNSKSAPKPPHLPGGVLLEVTVEVRPDGGPKRDWDDVKSPYAAAVEAMIVKSAENLHLKSISSKRSKRLSEGALFIVWVQFGEAEDDGHTYAVLQSGLLRLQGRSVEPPDVTGRLVVLSVSIEDIDECRTRLATCDVHAECVNEFGSYSCLCLHGYSPGLGGAVCVKPHSDDCSRTSLLLSVLCFLLCTLTALVLAALLLLYRRYHRGRFLPRCPYSSSTSFTATDIDNNHPERNVGSSSGPPPPAPTLHLLRFSSLTPPKGSEGKPPAGKL
ncbi:uncharacterized protein zgc:66455 [Trichomycterus rosablanca]|uniref:uncharacterized protein zgc:66455 n=1 Tax=Trichomycterus rosablanca TaxID=2290929 RepID=UPI002F356C36